MSDTNELRDWRNKNLNSISPSFCAAKWYNASLHLGHGFTNSCHLPLPHPVDLEEIKTNPGALHNTKLKKEARKMMLDGRRPAECSYCWKVEDIGRDHIADRVYKSRIYKEEDIAKLRDLPWDADVLLKTVEVSFDRTCNFACSYCNSGYSTTWGKEIKKFGPYQKFKTVSAGAYYADGSWADKFGKQNDDNPYVQAFIRWWPDLVKELEEIRITGGEPTMSHNFWSFLDVVKRYPSNKLRLAVNSNLGGTFDRIQRLIDATHELPIKEFDLYTSNESFGKHAEYIRDGLIYPEWRSNMVKFIERAEFRSLTVMMTINSLCLFSITEFLDDMITLKEKYGPNRPNVDFNILRWPAFMSPLVLPNSVKNDLHRKFKTWYDERRKNEWFDELFSVGEKAQIERLIDYIEVVETGHVTTERENELHFHDFKSFYSQYDERRGKSFVETFPELKDWYESIEVDKTIPDVELRSGEITHFEDGEYNPN
jgi:organic radical activating enzyme